MATTRRGRGRRSGRPGLERLEGRALLNASIDITADGAVIYRTDLAAAQTLLVAREGDVYTFAVDPSDSPIDVTSNAGGLAVSGSGTRTVTVAAPTLLRIEAASDGQTIRVRSTGVATQIVLQADSERVILGDDLQAGSGGVQALAGPIAVTASAGSELNSLLVADGPAAYDAASRPTYVLSAGAIASTDPVVQTRFAGISYAGVSSLTIRGTTDPQAAAPLYQVLGTAAGVATTIDAAGGPSGRDVAIQGTSSDPTSRLAILASGATSVWVASLDSPATYASAAGRTSMRFEAVRGSGYGLDADFVVLDGGDGVDAAFGNYWNVGALRGTPDWFLGFDPGSTEYAALRDADNPAVGGFFYRPAELHSIGFDARGNRGASLMVDFRNGDPLPRAASSGAPGEPAPGLTYVGASAAHPGSPYALSLVGAPSSGAFASAFHQVFPLYRGQIDLASSGETRRIAYQLSAGAPVLDDATSVADYKWFYDIMNGSVDGVRTLPDGREVSAILESTLNVTAGVSITSEQALLLAEANANAFLARYLISGKSALRIDRGWSYGGRTTTVNYRPAPVVDDQGESTIPPVAGLNSLYIADVSPDGVPTNDVVRLQALPPAISAFVNQGFGDDSAVVSLPGIAGATLVGLDAAGNGPAEEDGGDTLYIDAGGLLLDSASFQVLAPGALRIPPLTADGAPLSFANYEDVQVFNSSTPTFTAQPTTIPATARVPLTDATAGLLTASVAGFSPVGLTAMIAWGDGTTSAGRIEAVPGAPGSFRVVGSHTYAQSGVYSPRVVLTGTGTATAEVAGVPITFQVAGSSGTNAPAPGLTARLAAASDSGVSDSDLATNVVRPTIEGTSALPGGWVAVYATPAGGFAAPIYLGGAAADATGAWSIASIAALPDGAYTVQATSASTSTWANGLASLPGPLVIDTLGPRVLGVSVAPLRREVVVVLRDRGGAADSGVGLDQARARDVSSYGFASGRGAPVAITSARVSPGSTNGSQNVTLNPASLAARGSYLLTVLSSAGRATGIRDLAGNPLDGQFTGSFPSGGANDGRDFRARLEVANNRLASIRPA